MELPVTSNLFVKVVALGFALLLMLCAGLAFTANTYAGRWRTEQAAHNATRHYLRGSLAMMATERNLLVADQGLANGTIRGLQLQVNGTMAILEKERKAAASRSAITSGAKSAPANFDEVVDHETSRKVIRHLNSALQRR